MKSFVGLRAAVLPLLLLLGANFLVGFSSDAEVPPAKSEFSKVTLLTGAISKGEDGDTQLQAGIKFELSPGWKIYWRHPGDAGLPMQLDWQDSKNVADIHIDWPAPRRFIESWGLEVYGYKKSVVIPLTVNIKDIASATRFSVLVDYSICSDICVPYKEELVKDIPANYKPRKWEHEEVSSARAKIPAKNGSKNLTIKTLRWLEETGNKGVIEVVVSAGGASLAGSDVFIEVEDKKYFRFQKPVIAGKTKKGEHILHVSYEKPRDELTLSEAALLLTLVTQKGAVEAQLEMPESPEKTVENPAAKSD